MRQAVRFILITLLTLGIFSTVSAETKLRVGYIPKSGFLEEDRAGHYRGYGYEYMEFLSKYGDWKFEYIPCLTWQECNEKLQSGMIDVLPAMPGDYRSLQNVIRTDHVIGRYPMELITHDGSIKPRMRIGTIPANAPLPSLPKVAKDEGFTYELVNFPTFYDMEEAFHRRELDGYIAPMLEPNKEKNVASIFDRQSYRLLVRPDRKDLLAAMNIAMDEMLMDQPNIRNRLNDKYLRTGGFPLILNRQEKDYLEMKRKLKTAILIKQKPYAYYDDAGNLQGVLPHLIRQISEDLEIEIELIDTNSPTEAINLIRNGQVDFIADCVCDFSWAGDLNMAPTQAFLMLDYVPIMRRDINLEDKLTVACDKNLLYTKNFIFPRFDEQHRVYADSLQECFRILSRGEADILFAPRSEVPYLIEETGAYNLEVAPEGDFSDEISLGVYSKSDSRLWRILNKEVNHLDTGKIRNIINEDMSNINHQLSLQLLIYQHPIRVAIILMMILSLIGAGIWYRFHLRRKQTEAMKHIAYNDSRYDLPNTKYFEEKASKICNTIETEENIYVVKFASLHSNGNYLLSDRQLRDEQLKNMAVGVKEKDWNLLTTTGDEGGSLFCLCEAKNDAEIIRLAREAISEFGYVVTEDSRIWLHMKAGISRVHKDLYLSMEQAKIACQTTQSDVLMFNYELEEKVKFEDKVTAYMGEALKNGEFQVWYQTEYDLKSHKTVGNELFIRWQSPELGFLIPVKFISIFERSGFIILSYYFVFEEACKLKRSKLDENAEVVPISVNHSSLHLSEGHYTEKIKSIFRKYKLPKGIIKIEFSERAFENLKQKKEIERVNGILRALQNIGIKIVVDNFGSSYSSYKLINSMPVDEIKIDRTLIEEAIESNRMRDILSNIISLGLKLKINVVCEGIETKEQEKLLIDLHCRYGQGFIYSETALLQESNNSQD
ncbi:MAG: EAL domain-containing protein [Selenomonadaceae bacterium]|nr:EAL domain-containing protein [Selenomonadaceae bacterium]